ncbi:MAG TPA: cell division protein ZipA, partial [Pseudomonas sp.]|nr:cell division protein ZipA [Pseudomonas sp.]
RDPHGFRGPALLQNILESGLRFGEMDIFHRHESMAGNGEVLFSMANAVKPGTFDLDDIDHFTTPAVSFFLGLPGPRHPKQAFDVMVAAARKLSQELNGELKDDQRSVLTAQTIEHYRQRIVEFERRQMTIKQR